MLGDKITVKIHSVDMDTADPSETYSEDLLSRLETMGFSMKGGLYVAMLLGCDGEDFAADYVRLARRIGDGPDVTDPLFGTRDPRNMEFFALRNDRVGFASWGADILNTMIHENDGKLPDAVAQMKFDSVDFSVDMQ